MLFIIKNAVPDSYLRDSEVFILTCSVYRNGESQTSAVLLSGWSLNKLLNAGLVGLMAILQEVTVGHFDPTEES